VSEGAVAATPAEARAAAERLGDAVMVKAQVLVGGRGKAGGIKLADTPDEAETNAEAILGMDIKGHTVHRVWIEEASDIAKEYYASVTFDRGAKKPLVMLSAKGGVDIEEVAETDPDALARLHVDPLIGFQPHQARWLAYHAGIDAEAIRGVTDILGKLYAGFIELDATLLEINPLILSGDGQVRALDAKVSIDGNALYRHPDMADLAESVTTDPQELLAHQKGVTYVKLDGDVGILGNGAGLVMSTLDVVALAGGRPANFLDAGGGSKAEDVVTALEVLLSDDKVKALLVNIFGGITRCDEVAEGLLTALDRIGATLPIVVRLDGTNEEEGRAIIAERAPSNVVVEATMLSAARRAVELAKEAA
jgi:succinyl-CoA synthetase beta subunit